jgi:hypothetical protein
MGGAPPADMKPGDSLQPLIVPLTVDGTPTEITVLVTLVAPPSPWPAIAGGVIGLLLVVAAAPPRRLLPQWVVIVVVGVAASAVGMAQYLSLPSETGPRWSWWVPPVIATLCGAALPFVPRSAPWLRAAFVLVAGAQLFLWGWARRSGLTKPVLPTSAPFWLDRLVSATGLVAGELDAAATGVNRDPPVRVNDRDLAHRRAVVAANELVEHLLRSGATAHQVERVRPVRGIGHRLRGDSGDAGLGPRHH